jgi:hypothetical protein
MSPASVISGAPGPPESYSFAHFTHVIISKFLLIQQWVRLQTTIINENRLHLADAGHRKYLAEWVEKHFSAMVR